MKRFAPGLVVALAVLPRVASADVTHTVGRGHTIEAIAHRYHVAVKAILDANHLKDARHLKVGQQLVIPGVNPPPAPAAKPPAHGPAHATVAAATPAHPARPAPPPTYAARPKTPGVIHLKRLATTEEANVRVSDRRGRLSPPTLHTMEHMLRYPNGQSHPIDPRLVFELPESAHGTWTGKSPFKDAEEEVTIPNGESRVVRLKPFEVRVLEGEIR